MDQTSTGSDSFSLFSCSFRCFSFLSPEYSPKEFLFIMAFVVPCISIVVCYARIFYIVRKTALRSHDTGSMLGNSIHSNRTQNNNHGKKPYATNNNKNVSDGTDVQLLPKSDDISGDSSARIDRIELPICKPNDSKTKITATTPPIPISPITPLPIKKCHC